MSTSPADAQSRLALVPLRVKLVAAVLALVALGLAIAGFLAAAVLRDYLLERVDRQLVTSSQSPELDIALATGASLTTDSDGRGRGRGPRIEPVQAFYIQLVRTDGSSQVLTNDDGAPELPTITTAYAESHDGKPFTVDGSGGSGRWRVAISVREDGTVALASSQQDVDDTVRRLVRIELVVGLAVLAALALAAYAVVRSSLRPLREVEQTAAAIAGGDLSLRVPRQDERTEVGRLAMAFNSMLGRIEGAFAAQRQSEAQARESEGRLRQFVADASHELRTPLTSIRGFAELYRAGAVAPGPDLDRVMGRVEGEAGRMGSLVEEMLLLARLDQQRPLEQAPVDLLHLAADAVHDAQAVDPTRTVRLDVGHGAEPPVVTGDEARLRQVLVNLLGNAVTHTPPGTPVDVRLRTTGGLAVLEVADQGPGLTAEQSAHVFERFYRADTARTRSAGGSGLGLSIVRAVVEAHGGRVGVRGTPGGGATFLVELPLAR